MGLPDHLSCLLKNLYAGQKVAIRTGHGTADWFQIGKGICQGYILSNCLFNLYAEYIMWNAGPDDSQAGIKIARRNINNHRWHHCKGWRRGSKEPLNDGERGWKAGLKLNIQKMKILASGPITSWQIDGKTVETVTDFFFLGSRITADSDCSQEIKEACSLEEKLWQIQTEY